MTPDFRAIDVLLIEDDPGDILITREAFKHHKIENTLRVAHDGQEGLDYLYQRGPHQGAPRPDLGALPDRRELVSLALARRLRRARPPCL